MWKAHFPPKVRVFASRLARNALPSNSNKKERNILTDDTCKICGVQSETDWPVSDDSQLQFTGPDWFLLLLDRLSEGERSAIILFFWRNWSDRNSMTHGGGHLSINVSARDLRALQGSTLFQIQHSSVNDVKGKNPLNVFAGKQRHKVLMETQTPKFLWTPLEEGWIKINVDGSYGETTGQASPGIIIRDFKGHVILSAWKYLFQCSSVEEAELLACREGLLLAHHWCHGPLIFLDRRP
jgi:hypothetical protein